RHPNKFYPISLPDALPISMSSYRLAAVAAAVIVGAANVASAQPPQNQDAIPDTPGTGPFTPLKEIDPGLPEHVVYRPADLASLRSEEHTSELQSRENLVCR